MALPLLPKFYGRNRTLLGFPINGVPGRLEIFGQLRQGQNLGHPLPPLAADFSLTVNELNPDSDNDRQRIFYFRDWGYYIYYG